MKTWVNATMEDMLTRDGLDGFYSMRNFLKAKAEEEGLRLVQANEPHGKPYINSTV